MDPDTLITASTYLNNLLAARGLLRNTTTIDFAKPSRETRAHIVNLLHDLLLKRDRDEESRNTLVETLQSLRIEAERKDVELEKLRTQIVEKDRALVAAQVEARTARADLKRLQSSAKSTHTQLAKSKALVDQIKIQCLNDVRKRDAQIERLKTHIQGQQRGNKSMVVAPTISVSGGSQRVHNAFNISVHELQDPAYSLKQETNEFLTQLSQSLSDENDGLIALVQGTLQVLRGLLGVQMPAAEHLDSEVPPDISGGGDSSPTGPTHERLALELTSLLDTLTGLLTNPNFVSVDEVDIRDEEIARLREGWERMESRWRDVLRMMDGWRQKMERTGDTIDLAELRRGLGLDADIEQLSRQLTATSSSTRRRRPSVILEDSVLEVPPTISRDSGVSILPCPADPPVFFDPRPPKSVKGQRLRQLSATFQSPRRTVEERPGSSSSDGKENGCELGKASLLISLMSREERLTNRAQCPSVPTEADKDGRPQSLLEKLAAPSAAQHVTMPL